MLLNRVLMLAVLASLSLMPMSPALAIDFIVDDAGSDPDADPPFPADDALCMTAGGTCTLHAAIEEANERTGPHTITFDTSVTAIALVSDIPDISAEIEIDGTNASAVGGRVDINGDDGIGGNVGCFALLSSGTVDPDDPMDPNDYDINNPDGGQGSTIKNFVIRNCSGDGIDAVGDGYLFEGNLIGVTPAGDAASGNATHGIDLSGVAPPPNSLPSLPDISSLLDNPPTDFGAIAAYATALQGLLATIADPSFITGNVISGNGQSAIVLGNPMTLNNFVAGNVIGLSTNSLTAIPNGTGGGSPPAISIQAGAYANFIGPGNVISGNFDDGIHITGAVVLPNFVMGNVIGPGGLPGLELGNGDHGIDADATLEDDNIGLDNETGYTLFLGPANIISDNKSDNGGAALDQYGGDASGGVLVDGEGVRIFGNAIGLFAFPAGAAFGPLDQVLDVGNSGNGIVITGNNNQVGGSEVFEANFILHNERHGILVKGSGTVGNIIQGNFIGVAPPTGLDVFNLGNLGHGIVVHQSSSTTIGGPGDLDDNVIAGNGINGIALRQGASTNGWSNLIQRNQIYGNGVTTAGEGIGIDLEGDCFQVVDAPNCNDPDPFPDADGDDPNDNYANKGQNRPVICTGAGVPAAGCTAPSFNAGTGATTSSWTIETRSSSTLRIEYFSLRPDGMSFLYDETVTTDANGLPTGGSCVAGICTSTGTPSTATDTRGTAIVMTATDLFPTDVPPVDGLVMNDPANNTSEISEPAGIPQEIAFSSVTYSTGEAAGTTQITLQRLGDPVGDVSIEVVLAGAPGTATGGGVDYDLMTVNPVMWANGDGADKTFTLSINDDTLDETDETVNLELQNPMGAIEGTPNAATLTITDNDDPPTISIADNSLLEGDVTLPLQFTATLLTASSFDVVVTYSTANGSATAPADYTAAVAQMATITAGNLSANFNIDIAGDLLDENDETFLVNMTATNTTVAGSDLQATGTIQDNDPLPLLSINDVGPQDEGDGPGTTSFNFQLSLNTASGRDVTARVTSGDAGDTAVAVDDYAIVNQLVTIPAGMLTAPLTVNVVGDTVFEPLAAETFTLTLAADAVQPLNATLADPIGIGTITNDDAGADLSITKTHAGNFTQGQVGATYTITVSNSAVAPTDGSLVTVTDTLPAGLTATGLSGTGWTCVLGTLTCTRTDVLAISSSYPAITLTVDVAGNATTPQVNMVAVAGGSDTTPINNSANDSTTIDGAPVAPDLGITKTHVGNFSQGQVGATYTITVSNSAAAPTDGTMVSVVDTLPVGLTATGLSGTGWTCVLGTLTCTRTDVLAISSSYEPITLTVDVAANASTPLVNTATLSGGGDTSPGNNVALDPTTVDVVVVAADLGITKTHVGDFTQGQVGATYTITVSNSAVAPTDGSLVTVTDALPVGLTATGLSGTGWTCVLGTLTCTRTDVLAVSSSYPAITLTVDVAGNATTPQVNMATVAGGGDTTPLNNTAADSTTITGAPVAPDLSISKTHVGNFTQGQVGATYTITVSNSAAAATDGTLVTVTDILPAGLTATAINGTGWTCVLGTLTCTRTDVLAVSSSYEPITLTVDVAGNATTPQVNMATVAGGGDTTPLNNAASDSTTIDPAAVAPDLSISKTHVGNFIQGQVGATYTITVSNSAAGPTDGTMVGVVDTLPVGLTATGLSGTGWTCVLGTLTCTRTDVLAVSSSYPAITLTVDVAGNATTPLVNMATVAGGGDMTPLNNTASDSTTIDPAAVVADLSISKTHVGDFTQGQVGATYTITVSNSATAPTDGSLVTVTDTLPVGLTATGLSGTGWTCVLGTLTCTRTDVLAVSSSYPAITLTVDVAANATTPQVNMATVSGGSDTTPLNNTAADSTTITGAPVAPDLSISKTHVGNFTQGQVGATYTITVSNSAAAATDGTLVTVTDTLPAGLTATAINGTGWTCVLGTLTCSRTDVLAVSSSYPAITLTVDVAGNATTPLVNMATVAGGGDTTPLNNTASDSTTVNVVSAGTLQFTPNPADQSVAENVGTATFTVSRTGGTNGAVSTTITLGGTATNPADFTNTTLVLNWANGDAANKTVTFTIVDDATPEGAETVTLALGAPTGGATLGAPSTATLTIQASDAAAGSVQFAAALPNQSVGEAAGTASYVFSRTGGSAGAISITVTLGGTAINPADYTNTPVVIAWADGDSADKLLTFTIVDDTAVESDETVTLSIGAPSGGAVVGAPGAATLTIIDNDGAAVSATPQLIPTMSPWMLALLGLLLCFFVARALPLATRR